VKDNVKAKTHSCPRKRDHPSIRIIRGFLCFNPAHWVARKTKETTDYRLFNIDSGFLILRLSGRLKTPRLPHARTNPTRLMWR
jgi:hypothetical protein